MYGPFYGSKWSELRTMWMGVGVLDDIAEEALAPEAAPPPKPAPPAGAVVLLNSGAEPFEPFETVC